jgi:hypothetical protein
MKDLLAFRLCVRTFQLRGLYVWRYHRETSDEVETRRNRRDVHASGDQYRRAAAAPSDQQPSLSEWHYSGRLGIHTATALRANEGNIGILCRHGCQQPAIESSRPTTGHGLSSCTKYTTSCAAHIGCRGSGRTRNKGEFTTDRRHVSR